MGRISTIQEWGSTFDIKKVDKEAEDVKVIVIKKENDISQ